MIVSSLRSPLTAFVDALPLPPRLLARKHDGHLTVRIRVASHRFHRELPPSRVWAFEGSVPGPRSRLSEAGRSVSSGATSSRARCRSPRTLAAAPSHCRSIE